MMEVREDAMQRMRNDGGRSLFVFVFVVEGLSQIYSISVQLDGSMDWWGELDC
jgi:hypothetical protein